MLQEIAALTDGQRVERMTENASHYKVSAATDEGTWVLSRVPTRGRGPGNFVLGRPGGVHGTDYVDLLDYGEVLLMDGAGNILRAYPLPGVPPQGLWVTDDAVYAFRSGDGGLPDSIICRIDRLTLDSLVRVYPIERLEPERVNQYEMLGWVVNDVLRSPFQQFVPDEDQLMVRDTETLVLVDLDTLELTRLRQ